MENILYLLASVSLTATRNITSKKTAAASKGLSQFFFSQSVLFLSAALLLAALNPAITGLCFGGANLLNTILAGRMKSAVFFPLQNISTILLSTLLGTLIFKEKITAKTAVIILLGALTVVVFSL